MVQTGQKECFMTVSSDTLCPSISIKVLCATRCSCFIFVHLLKFNANFKPDPIFAHRMSQDLKITIVDTDRTWLISFLHFFP